MHETESAGSLWRHRDFMLLWGGQSVSLIGAQVTVLALPLLATLTLHASTFQVALLTSFSTLPWLLFSLPAGVIVDRSRKREVMLWCDVARFAVLCTVPVAGALGALSLVQLYAVALVSGTLAVLFNSAYLSFPGILLTKSQLVDANGKVSTASAAAGVIGPSSAGFLVALVGAATAVTADAVSYLVSAGGLLLVRFREPRPAPKPASDRGFRRELSAGLRIIVADRILTFVTISNSLGNFLLAAISSVWVLYAVRDLGWSAQTVGLVGGISAVGGVIGSLIAKPLIKRYGLVRVLLFSPVPFAPGQIVAGYVLPGVHGQIMVTIGFTVTLASALTYNIAQRSYRMASCPPGMLGRLNATASWLQWGLRPLAGVVGGALGTALGLRPTVLLFAWLLPSVAVILWLSLLRKDRGTEGRDSAPPAPAMSGATGGGRGSAVFGERELPAADTAAQAPRLDRSGGQPRPHQPGQGT
ncbi:MFS transporter [Streptomyces sp. NPDC002078]